MTKYSLDKIAKIKVGNVQHKDVIAPETSKGADYLVYAKEDFKFDRFETITLPNIKEKSYLKNKKVEYVAVSKGDVVVGSLSFHVALVRQEEIMLLNQNYFKIELDEEKCSSKFFIFWFNEIAKMNEKFREKLDTKGKITQEMMYSLVVDVPNNHKEIGEQYFKFVLEQRDRQMRVETLKIKVLKQEILNQKGEEMAMEVSKNKVIVSPCPVCDNENVSLNYCSICGRKNDYEDNNI